MEKFGLMTYMKLTMILGLMVFTAACQKAADSSVAVLSSRGELRKAQIEERPTIIGPQVVVYFDTPSFNLSIPAGQTIVSATWNFGDGSPEVSSLSGVDHRYSIGTYEVTVRAVKADQTELLLTHTINVLDFYDGVDCLPSAGLVSPTVVEKGEMVPVSLNVPDCLSRIMTSAQLDFGDGSNRVSGISAQHVYDTEGVYVIRAYIHATLSDNGPFLVLSREIQVVDVPDEPENPLACPTSGETRTSYGADYTESAACGLNGTKTMTYRTVIVEECQAVNDELLWTIVSQTPELISEGECQGQACRLSDGSILNHNESRTFYTTANPANSCQEVAETRTCINGILNGSEQANQLTCNNGCGAFGPHGTVKIGIIIGESQVPKVCQYGETGIFDIYNRIEDQACNQGQVVSSNERQGDLKSAGSCPTYSWVGSDLFTACSADCGGEQSRIFNCQDNSGNAAPEDRCTSAKPVESRLCDANPEAVRRTESETVQQDGSSSAQCPKNQIGVIVKIRDVTTTKTYACIDHKVQLESQNVQYGAWETENYCRDYVAHRCSHDSLTNKEARGRYNWMLKCKDQVSVIAEFLEQFKDVEKDGHSIDSTSRILYPTFMNYAFKPEKPWIAPKSESGSCSVPSTIYVASVCVSSCATPEQQILAEAKSNRKLKYTSFIDALTANTARVSTLSSNSSLSKHQLESTRVQQWVTELIDTEHVILEFRMKSGGSVRLTPNHPIVTEDGSMKLAEDFKVGDSLVQLGGKLDQVVAIETQSHVGKVYNLFVNSSEPLKNVVVTNGYLNGTAFFQNQGAELVNRQLLKNKLTRGVLE